MSILSRLGLIEEDKPKVVKVEEPQPVIQQAPAPISMTGAGGASDELIATISGNIKAKAPDNAYFKLRSNMDIMMVNKLDECSAAKGASAVLALQSADVSAAIDEVITLVMSEKEGFMSTVYAQAVQAADALSTHSAELQTQINELLEKVKQLSDENINTQQEATKAHSEADVLAATFDASVAKFTNILTAEKQKLITYLS